LLLLIIFSTTTTTTIATLSTSCSTDDNTCTMTTVQPLPLRTGVLVHGCHMQAIDVARILWGVESDRLLGRVPKGALLALQLDADILLFGTGATFDANGIVEAEHTRNLLTADVLRLRRFPGVFDAFSDTQLHALVHKCELELTSRNTVQEIRAAATLFAQRGLERMVLVSSNTHAPRCLRDATVVLAELRDQATDPALAERYTSFLLNLLVAASDIPYANATPAMVQIVEPPHIPNGAVSFDRLVGRLFKVPADQRVELAEQFDAMLQRFNV
jgi:hypothetical protein